MAAPARSLRRRQALADPLHRGLANSALRQSPPLEDLTTSREECEPMFIRDGDQLFREIFGLGCLPRGDRRNADYEKRIRKSMRVAELPGTPERLAGCLERLIRVTTMPECQCPAGDCGDPNIRPKPRVERGCSPAR